MSLLLNRKNIAFTSDSENTDPLLHYHRQEEGGWSWPLNTAVDWVFCHPPREWLSQYENPGVVVEGLIRNVLTKTFSNNVIFFVRPPLEKFKIMEIFWSQGWDVRKLIDLEGSYATPSKEKHTQYIAEHKLMEDSASILVMKNG